MTESTSFWDRDFTVRQVLTWLGSRVLRFIALALTFLIAQLQALDELTWSRLRSLDVFGSLSSGDWVVILGGAVLIMFASGGRTYLENRGEDDERDETIIYKTIGGAIDHLNTVRSNPDASPDHCFSSLLRYIERVVEAILAEARPEVAASHSVIIGANLMLHEHAESQLRLKYFGTPLTNREKLTLPVNESPPRPGAPAAFAKGTVVYVEDTTAPEYAKFFDEQKDYRSIISIPVAVEGNQIIAIVNVDSNIKDHFGSIEFIKTKLIPKVEPFIGLIRLERDML